MILKTNDPSVTADGYLLRSDTTMFYRENLSVYNRNEWNGFI